VKEKVSDLAIVLSAQGGTLGDIPASALGFAKIYNVNVQSVNNGGGTSNDKGSDLGMYSDGSGLFWAAYADGSQANYTGTVYCRVVGTPKL
jgi:hypothetical protein